MYVCTKKAWHTHYYAMSQNLLTHFFCCCWIKRNIKFNDYIFRYEYKTNNHVLHIVVQLCILYKICYITSWKLYTMYKHKLGVHWHCMKETSLCLHICIYLFLLSKKAWMKKQGYFCEWKVGRKKASRSRREERKDVFTLYIIASL